MITLERLRELLDYDPLTGLFRWRVSRGCVKEGAIAGRKSVYIDIRIDGVLYQAHQLAWFYMVRQWPVNEIDHKDRDKHHNAWFNLREATRSQNVANGSLRSTNTTGFHGVSRRKDGRFVAQIRYEGRAYWLGAFDEAKVASEAYRAAALEFFGEFATTTT